MSQSQANEAYISVRIVTMDSYQGEPMECLDPFTSDRGYETRRVPVMRVFGPTPAGQNVCLHIHGIFPYLYIPMPEKEDDGFPYRLASSIDKAINTGFNQSKSSVQHVYKALKVSGRPFYGYHPRQHNFIKIYFYNYYMMKRASDLLANGGILNQVLQPHESHVPFELQFMMDYNLQGMNLIHLRHAVFRQGLVPDEYDDIEPFEDLKPISKERKEDSQSRKDFVSTPTQSSMYGTPGSGNDSCFKPISHASERLFYLDDLPDYLKLTPDIKKVSTCELEIDAVAADILNSNDLAGDGSMNPGLKALWEDERARRRILGIKDPLTPPVSPPRSPSANESSESEKFWMARFDTMLKEKKEREGTRDLTPSQDPDATINIQHSIGSSVYATETSDQDLTQLPPATQLESHVTTLSTTILEASSSANTPSSSSADTSLWLSQSHIGTPRRGGGATQSSDEFDENLEQDDETAYLDETQIVLDESDEELVDILLDLADEENAEDGTERDKEQEKDGDNILDILTDELETPILSQGTERKTDALETIPPSQSSSIEFNPLSPLQIISSPSTQSTDSQSSRQRVRSGGFSQSQSPTPFQHLTSVSSQSPRRYQPLSGDSSQSPGRYSHLSGGFGSQSPGQRQRYKSGSGGGCSSEMARASQEDILNQSLRLADAADTSLGLLDAGDEFTGDDALDDDDLLTTLEMTQQIWDQDPFKDDDSDSNSSDESEKNSDEKLDDDVTNEDDLLDMSVWNPETEQDLEENDAIEIAKDDEKDITDDLVQNDAIEGAKVNENADNDVLENESDDILNSSIWSSDNDDELLKTLEIEESNLKK